MTRTPSSILFLAWLLLPGQAWSQPADRFRAAGRISVLFDAVPRQDASEWRPSVRIDLSGERGAATKMRYGFDVALHGLVARRQAWVRDAAFEPQDVWIEVEKDGFDVRAGYGRVIWGRLDEIAPSDVVNPLDASRFLLEGRSEARRAVGFVRARVFASEDWQIEGVLVPRFRRGVFDRLDERSSPFNLLRTLALPVGVIAAPDVEHVEPRFGWNAVSGGVRVSATAGRTDVAGAIYRGYDAFGRITFRVESLPAPPAPAVVRFVEEHRRFTMGAADFETVLGDWAVRGEVAVKERSLDVGAGFDRRAGSYRLFGTLLVQRDRSTDTDTSQSNATIIGSVERTYQRERWLTRVFSAVNLDDHAAFVRGVVVWRPQDNVAIEWSAAAFLGTSDDTIGQFKGRDFAFARLTYHF